MKNTITNNHAGGSDDRYGAISRDGQRAGKETAQRDNSRNTTGTEVRAMRSPRMLKCALIASLAGAVSVFANPAAEIAKKAFASTVLVVIEDTHGQPVLLGSGFVLREHAIVTNMHVIDGASHGYAKQIDNNTKHKIEGILQADNSHDLAVLSVPSLSAPALPIGDSKKLEVGDTVYAVGNPRGLEGTFSQGIVSSIRNIDSQTILQITAPISPGSSGGPILNESGEVIGVAVATFKDGQNLNFAIPASYLSTTVLAEKPLPFASAPKKPSVGPGYALAKSPSDFVEQFVADLANNDVDTQLRYYADRTNYYEFGQVGKPTVSRDLRSDIKAWPNRTYSIRGTPKITPTNNGFTAQFPMAYSLAGTKGVSSGLLEITLEAEFHTQTPQITQVHKKVISARRAR
jgi:hypothetical protein